jgi:hypothetical protein
VKTYGYEGFESGFRNFERQTRNNSGVVHKPGTCSAAPSIFCVFAGTGCAMASASKD